MLHLVDRFGPLERGEPLDAEIVEQPVVEPILIGGGELVPERAVEVFDDLVVALHRPAPCWMRCLSDCSGGGSSPGRVRLAVIPAEAGISLFLPDRFKSKRDSSFRWNDGLAQPCPCSAAISWRAN